MANLLDDCHRETDDELWRNHLAFGIVVNQGAHPFSQLVGDGGKPRTRTETATFTFSPLVVSTGRAQRAVFNTNPLGSPLFSRLMFLIWCGHSETRAQLIDAASRSIALQFVWRRGQGNIGGTSEVHLSTTTDVRWGLQLVLLCQVDRCFADII